MVINKKIIRAAIFDMDGTLIDSLMLWDVFWREVGTRFLQNPAFRPNAEDERAVRTLPLDAAMDLITRHYGLGASGDEIFQTVEGILGDFYAHQVQMKPGTREFLEACRGIGIRMCVASATAPDLLDRAMEHCGLRPYFCRIFSCAENGKGKDRPDIFLETLAFLGTAREETAVFEDSPVALETAAGLGLPTVGIYDRYNPEQERVRNASAVYVASGETLMKLF